MTERKLGLVLTLGIVLELLEILRRLPRWLLLLAALLLYLLVYVVYFHPWWTAAVIAAVLSLRLSRRTIGERRL